MKYADRRLSPAAVILGEDELAAGTVTVKDLDLGRELAVQGHRQRRLARASGPASRPSPRAELVAGAPPHPGRRLMRVEPAGPGRGAGGRSARRLEAAGASRADAPLLQPLNLLLDLAGEAMRARLFVVQAEGGAESCLRPDFTVAIARQHMAQGGRAAGATSTRARPSGAAPAADRPEEFLQLGAGDVRAGDGAVEARRRRDRGPGLARGRGRRARRPVAAGWATWRCSPPSSTAWTCRRRWRRG